MNRDATVAGESATAIMASLSRANQTKRPGGGLSIDVSLDPHEAAPVLRAMMRIEAEFLPIEQGSYTTISGTSMASPHAAGALALLASTNNPGNATDVGALYGQVINAGNFDWTDDSGDGVLEPLLDVTGFTAALTSTGDGGGGTDAAPTVSITSPAEGTTVDAGATVGFTGSASDAEDGSLSSTIGWSSNLDGSLGSGASINAALSTGTHTVTASVTDSGSNTATDSITVIVAEPSTGGIDLGVTAYKNKGRQAADLTWSGASGTNVDVFRNGGLVATTANDGSYTDAIGVRGGGTATYQVCETTGSTCSSVVTVAW